MFSKADKVRLVVENKKVKGRCNAPDNMTMSIQSYSINFTNKIIYYDFKRDITIWNLIYTNINQLNQQINEFNLTISDFNENLWNHSSKGLNQYRPTLLEKFYLVRKKTCFPLH